MQEQNNNPVTISSPTGKEIKIGKPKAGYINVFCNFRLRYQSAFINSLDNGLSLEIVNYSNYDHASGGIAIKILNGMTYETAVAEIKSNFEANVE